MTLALFIFALTSAFLSGILALFAPCCITFLLPSYFASAFQARQKIIAMTAVFFLGLATILVPISLGAAWLAQLFSHYHSQIFIIGAFLLIFYGVLAFFGKTVMLPFHYQPDLTQPRNSFGTYTLGIFSGIASSCCAPVLAGMLTLTALTASLPLAFLISLAYIFGMTLPLFVLSLIWDKTDVGNARWFKGKPITIKLGAWKHTVHSTHLLVSALFISIGLFVLYVALHGEAALAASWQTRIISSLQSPITTVSQSAANHPFVSLVAYLLIAFGAWLAMSRISKGGK